MITTLWDAADHLDNKEAILGYLEAVSEDGDPDLIAAALNDVARAKGLADNPMLVSDADISAVVRTLGSAGPICYPWR